MKQLLHIAPAGIILVLMLSACGGEDQSPGIEYMPDMYRSPAIEAYVDYGQDPYYFGDSLARQQRRTLSARKPVQGTVVFNSDTAKAHFNFPYPYDNTSEGYELAGVELKSPFERTEESIAEGKDIYQKFCIHCHGKTGQGDGSVVSVGGHPPPNAYDKQLKDLSEGKMFHSITYGKGVMGSHASQLNKEERWKVIHYVQVLQGHELGANSGTIEEMVQEVELVEEEHIN